MLFHSRSFLNVVAKYSLQKSQFLQLEFLPFLQKIPVRYNSNGRNVVNYSTDANSTKKCKLEGALLKSRSLLKLTGQDTHQLLQGLVTNDITHLESRPAIYTLFLNNQGRVLWDALVFQVPDTGETFIECDSSIKSNLIKHLKIFRLRRKVEIIDAGDGDGAVDSWVVFDPGHTSHIKELAKEECCGPILQVTSKRADLPVGVESSLRSFGDPRLNELGWRVFVPRSKSEVFPPNDIIKSDEDSYTRLRYALGVAEGVQELPSASCFPLESNGDYLHGVSFQKGCYVGQELTARTHHTGVIRKRIMPFRISEGEVVSQADPTTLQIVGPTGKSVGKVRGICGSFGIGLIRIEQALAAPGLKIQDLNINISIEKPFWWPVEASKEKQTKQ